MERVVYFVAVLFVTGSIADPATQLLCEDATNCEVTNVDIAPCNLKNQYCTIKLGKNASINFDFTPQFDASELLTDVTYMGVSFKGLDTDACKASPCPVASGVKQTFHYNLALNKKLPKGQYLIKWKVWNKANAADLCCFQTKLKLH